MICYDLFLCLALDLTDFISVREDFMTVVFRYFDLDANGLITEQDIAQALRYN